MTNRPMPLIASGWHDVTTTMHPIASDPFQLVKLVASLYGQLCQKVDMIVMYVLRPTLHPNL